MSTRLVLFSLRLVLILVLGGTAVGSLSAQATGRIVGRVVDAEKGAPVAGAQVDVVGAAIHAVSALDGRYTLAGVPAGPVSVQVRMIGFAPKTVTGIAVPAGGTAAQDIAMVAEAVQLAEISVNAAAEQGTVNRALEEQRNAVNIVNSVSAEQISKSPDSDAGQAMQRVSGLTVQDGNTSSSADWESATPTPRSTGPGSRAPSRSGRSCRSISSPRACCRESPPPRPSHPNSRETSAAPRVPRATESAARPLRQL